MDFIAQKIASVVHDLFDVDTAVQLDRPDLEFGDCATNVAMKLAGLLKQNPHQIAEQLAVKLRSESEFTEVTVAGPGFINVRLSDETLLRQLREKPSADNFGKTIVIETNNPNPFKPMHIGHAYNAIIADTLANLYAVGGATVHRVSYHGDIGTHVGKSMWALLRYCDGNADKLDEIPKTERNEFMGKMYVEGAKAASDSEAVKKEIDQLAADSYTQTDPLYAKIYNTCLQWSFDQIDTTVACLGNIPTERRYLESQADPIGVTTVRQHVPEVFKESNGAVVFEGSKFGSFDNVFIGSNGHGLYAARDLGLIQLKVRDYPTMDVCVVVTASEQKAYFNGVIAATEQALPALKGKLKNISTGVVKLSTGKMSSRTGDVITIEWLFDEFRNAIIARGGELTDGVVAGALRYQFLKVKIGGDVVFDIHEAVSLTGNTGSYLQYAHARARTIVSKSHQDVVFPSSFEPEDRALVLKMGEYAEAVTRAERMQEPHHICAYLFALAQEFNRYYEKNQVIGSNQESHRLAIVALYADILAAGLTVLGIEAPNHL